MPPDCIPVSGYCSPRNLFPPHKSWSVYVSLHCKYDCSQTKNSKTTTNQRESLQGEMLVITL